MKKTNRVKFKEYGIYVSKRLKEHVVKGAKSHSVLISQYARYVLWNQMFANEDFTDTDNAKDVIWRYRRDERVDHRTPRDVRIVIYFPPEEWMAMKELMSFIKTMPKGFRSISIPIRMILEDALLPEYSIIGEGIKVELSPIKLMYMEDFDVVTKTPYRERSILVRPKNTSRQGEFFSSLFVKISKADYDEGKHRM